MNELFYEYSPAHAVLSRAAWLYLKFVGLTSRVRVAWQAGGNGPAVFAFWHRQEAPMVYVHRDKRLCGIVSKSKDGEYMARIVRLFGFNFVRGSTTSGGIMALRGLIRAARSGYSIGITPDGPRGPVFKVQPGALYVAQKTGLPVIPLGCALSRAWNMRSWDRYQFPLPFGRTEAVYGEPLYVSATDDLAAKALELERRLNEVTAEAERRLALP